MSILDQASLIAALYALANIIIILLIETCTKGDKNENGKENYGSKYNKVQHRKKYVLIADIIVFSILLIMTICGISNSQ